ncbi:hypothetical protein FO519_000181 [Halicephalobus sp. NKZ332]|nr:hypothetical protein FO519_000181 [Halicephalobus sp. NKZ332]
MNILGTLIFLIALLSLVDFSEARYRLKFPRDEFGMSLAADDVPIVRVRRHPESMQNRISLRKKRFTSLDLEDPDKAILSFLEDDTNFLPPHRGEGIA